MFLEGPSHLQRLARATARNPSIRCRKQRGARREEGAQSTSPAVGVCLLFRQRQPGRPGVAGMHQLQLWQRLVPSALV